MFLQTWALQPLRNNHRQLLRNRHLFNSLHPLPRQLNSKPQQPKPANRLPYRLERAL